MDKPKKYQGKYRIDPHRRTYWDYGQQAAYFITLCTKDRIRYFGKIEHHIMLHTPIGAIAFSEWEKTPLIRPEMNLTLGAFIIMPDHFHAIITIGKNPYNSSSPDTVAMHRDSSEQRDSKHRDSKHRDSKHRDSSEQRDLPKQFPGPYFNRFGPQRKNLASIIRGYKSAVTTRARKNNIKFAWQSNYHDIIIRDEYAYKNISRYIINNPKAWKH